MKFKLKDKVRFISGIHSIGSEPSKGTEGVIVVIEKGQLLPFGVEFKEFKRGHDCGGVCKKYHGWYVSGDQIIKVSNELSKKVSNKKVLDKRLKIIKEISLNKDYKKCFKNLKEIKKEVETWDESKIMSYNLD